MEVLGVLKLKQKKKVIDLYLKGETKSEIARTLNISRPTVIKYINEYELNEERLEAAQTTEEEEAIIVQSSQKPTYNSENRKRRKITPEVEELIEFCLEENKAKLQKGQRKLIMKKVDIHEYVVNGGHDVSYRALCQFISDFEEKEKTKETYIKQSYSPGECAEFDWGEVTLDIKELGGEYRMKIGVFALKHSDYVWARLYTNENTESFKDIHVKYFKHIQGTPKGVAYDNALVNVTRMAGKEKRPSKAVQELSEYYGYLPRYTNYYSGNEKGTVERSVEIVRRKAYCTIQCFDTIADAEAALLQAVDKINLNVKQRTEETAVAAFADEQKSLLPNRIPMDSSQLIISKVNKYGFIYVDCNFYSVPDYLTGKKVTVKKYSSYLRIYFDQKLLLETKRLIGRNQYQIDMNHYLKTLKKKPGAIAHSLALKQANPWLQSIFHNYYSTNPKDFIAFLEIINDYSLSLVQLAVKQLEFSRLPVNYSYLKNQLSNLSTPVINNQQTLKNDSIQEACQKQLLEISSLYQQEGDSQWIN